jgi:glycosyltransferase involved in cell wall biosynthesis
MVQGIDFDQLTEESSSLLIYVTGDFTKLKSGSHVRFDQMIRYATNHFDDVVVYTYRNNVEDPWTDASVERFNALYPSCRLLLDDQTKLLKLLTRVKNTCLMLAPKYASRILRWSLKNKTPAYHRQISNPLINTTMLVNFVDGLVELNGVSFEKLFIDTIDSKYIRFAKFRNVSLLDWKSLARLRSEIGILSKVCGIIAISNAEAGFFRSLCSDQRVMLVPCYFDNNKKKIAKNSPTNKTNKDLLFVGSDNRYNRDGIKRFIRHNGLLLQDRTLDIAGAVCADGELQSLSSENPNIRLLGWVDDLDELYTTVKAVIVPVDGTGLNIKLVEALAHGKPVFASRHARDALPSGSNECVFEIDQDVIRLLLDDNARRESAEIAALTYSHSDYMRGDIGELTALLMHALKQKPAPS